MQHPLTAGLLVLLASIAPAQERPNGIYCSCGATSAAGGSSYTPAIAARPFVDGFLVRVPWSDLEPSPGVYDWSLIENQVALISSHGKRIALGVVQSDSGTPDWLAGLGVELVTYSFAGSVRTIALPWDPIYLDRWTSFVAALGARFHGEATIDLVHATHATHNGFEMHLPFGEEQQYLARGYTDALYADSWRTVLDAFASAFPDTWLDVDVHPIWGSDAVAQQVLVYGATTIGDRFGAFGAWWSQKNALEVYTGMYDLFLAIAPVTFTTAQNVGSWITTPERYDFDLATYEASFRLAVDAGVRYVEVWNQDLLAPELETFLSEQAAELTCSGWSMHYGEGTLGTGGLAPDLDVEGCPSAGGLATVRLSHGASNAFGWLGLGSLRTAWQLFSGNLWIGPVGHLLVTPIQLSLAGTWSVDWQVPLSAHLTVTGQALVLDDFAVDGIAFSNALEIRVR